MIVSIDPKRQRLVTEHQITLVKKAAPKTKTTGPTDVSVQIWRKGSTYYVSRFFGDMAQHVNVARSREQAEFMFQDLRR